MAQAHVWIALVHPPSRPGVSSARAPALSSPACRPRSGSTKPGGRVLRDPPSGPRETAERHERDFEAQRADLGRLERRVARVDRRAPARGRQEERGDLDALEGALKYLSLRLDRIEARQRGELPRQERALLRRLTFLTSIGPVDLDRQERAIRSWLGYGDVVSFNCREEAAGIQAALQDRAGSPLAEVTFSPVSATAVKEVGRPCVYVDDILDFIGYNGDGDRAFAIVNSDIVVRLDGLVERRSLGDSLLDLLATGPIFGSRVEVTGDDLEPVESEITLADGTYFWGFDYFILTGDQVRPLERNRFVFGQPWWDYYLPFELLHKHGVLFYLENRIALHVQHPVRWNSANFRLLEQRFAEYRSRAGRGHDAARDAQDVCREIHNLATRIKMPAPGA